MKTVFYLLVFCFFFTFSAFSQKKTSANASKETPSRPVAASQPVAEVDNTERHYFFVMAPTEDRELYKFLESYKENKSFTVVPVKSKIPVFLVVSENEILLDILRRGLGNLVTFDSKQAKLLGILFQSPEVLDGEYLQKYLKSF